MDTIITFNTTQLQRQLQSIDRCDKTLGAIATGLIYTVFIGLGFSIICCIYANCPGDIGAFFQGILFVGFFAAIGCIAILGAISIVESSLFKRMNRVRIALGLQPYRISGGIR